MIRPWARGNIVSELRYAAANTRPIVVSTRPGWRSTGSSVRSFVRIRITWASLPEHNHPPAEADPNGGAQYEHCADTKRQVTAPCPAPAKGGYERNGRKRRKVISHLDWRQDADSQKKHARSGPREEQQRQAGCLSLPSQAPDAETRRHQDRPPEVAACLIGNPG